MEASRRKKVILRWTLFITVIVAAYRLWGWYVSGGLEPFTQWRFDVNEAHDLGFAVSPLWDLPVAALITALLSLIYTSPRMDDKTDPDKESIWQKAWIFWNGAFGAGALFGLLWAVNNGLTIGMGLGFIATFGVLLLIIVPILLVVMLVAKLVLSTPLKALGRWLMAR